MLHMWHPVGMTAPTKTPPVSATAWIPDLNSFGARLALVRQKMGWGNVAEAARECGIDRESWRLWEQTGREPRRFITIAMAIANRTGVDLDWLVYGPDRLRERPQTTNQYLRRDPLAPRVVTVVGDVRHGDGRKVAAPDQRVSARSGRNRSTSTHGKRPVSRVSLA